MQKDFYLHEENSAYSGRKKEERLLFAIFTNMGTYQLREQDRWLPIANVARLMKNTLPPTAKVSKDAKECMQECVSEFISFITSEASDKCVMEKRKTINGEDILNSMTTLGFENYGEVLKIYLAKYRQQQALKQSRGEPRKKKAKTSNSGNAKKVKVEETGEIESKNRKLKDENKSTKQGKDKHTNKESVVKNEPASYKGIDVGYVDQLYEQSYGDGNYAHNPNYHNPSYGGGVDLTQLPLDPSQAPKVPQVGKTEKNKNIEQEGSGKESMKESLDGIPGDSKHDSVPSTRPDGQQEQEDSVRNGTSGNVRQKQASSQQTAVKIGNGTNSDSNAANNTIDPTNVTGNGETMGPRQMKKTTTTATSNDAELSLSLNDNVASAVSETEELAGLANGHHGENVLYRYQGDF